VREELKALGMGIPNGNVDAALVALAALEQQAADEQARLDEAEAYAKEGWDWLQHALDALGVKTVFDIKGAEARAVRAEEAEESLKAMLASATIARDNWHASNYAERQARVRAEEALRQIADTEIALQSHRTRAQLVDVRWIARRALAAAGADTP
jgi:hypothetical protein